MPTEEKVIRKLRAILSADVKGYSLLMSDDEAFTVKTLKSYRTIMSEKIDQHTGRVIDDPGDQGEHQAAQVGNFHQHPDQSLKENCPPLPGCQSIQE